VRNFDEHEPPIRSMQDETPTPRHTPFLSSGPILAALANDYAKRLDNEAASIGRDMPNRCEVCRDLARRMRALMLEFDRWSKTKPTADSMQETVARWHDARAQAEALRLPGGELTL
jgi:hypothetical protein